MNKDVPNIKSEPSYKELLDHAKKLFDNDDGNSYLQKLQSASDANVDDLYKEMQQKYRKMALTCHPDKNVNKEVEEKASAEAKFKEINEAKDFFTKFFEEYTKEKESVKKFKSQEDKKSFNDFAKGKTRQSISSDGLDVFWAEFLRTQRQQQEQQRQEQQRQQQQQQQQQHQHKYGGQEQAGGKRRKKHTSNKSVLKMMMAAFKNKSAKKQKGKRRRGGGEDDE